MIREALTVDLRSPEAKLVWIIRIWLAMLAFNALLFEPIYTTKPLLFLSATWGLGVGLLMAFVPTQRPRTLKGAEAAMLLAFAMHVMGHTFGWYQHLPWYDTLLHFSVPMVIVLILYGLSQATNWIWDWRKVSAVEVAIYLFAMSVAIGAIWEVIEFGMDQFFGTHEQDDLFDTMIDLTMDVAGALAGALLAWAATRFGQRNGFERISEAPDPSYARRSLRGASK